MSIKGSVTRNKNQQIKPKKKIQDVKLMVVTVLMLL